MKNKEIMFDNKTKLKELEQEYIDDMIKKMPDYIQERKKTIINDIIKYANEHKKPVKWNSNGEPIGEKVEINPLVISNYFFKPITSISSVEPIYSPEELGLIYDYYCFLIAEINDKIGYFPPSLTSFCKLSSLTLQTLRNYKNSQDYSMRVITEKIYDQIGDENITMSQMGITREKSTIFKLKAQNEMVEKVQPQVTESLNIVVDLDKINERINKYKQFASKKGK